MEKKLIKSIFLRFKTNNIRLKIQCPQGRAGSTLETGESSSVVMLVLGAILGVFGLVTVRRKN